MQFSYSFQTGVKLQKNSKTFHEKTSLKISLHFWDILKVLIFSNFAFFSLKHHYTRHCIVCGHVTFEAKMPPLCGRKNAIMLKTLLLADYIIREWKPATDIEKKTWKTAKPLAWNKYWSKQCNSKRQKIEHDKWKSHYLMTDKRKSMKKHGAQLIFSGVNTMNRATTINSQLRMHT